MMQHKKFLTSLAFVGILFSKTFAQKVEKLIISYDTLYLVNLQTKDSTKYSVTVLKKEKMTQQWSSEEAKNELRNIPLEPMNIVFCLIREYDESRDKYETNLISMNNFNNFIISDIRYLPSSNSNWLKSSNAYMLPKVLCVEYWPGYVEKIELSNFTKYKTSSRYKLIEKK